MSLNNLEVPTLLVERANEKKAEEKKKETIKAKRYYRPGEKIYGGRIFTWNYEAQNKNVINKRIKNNLRENHNIRHSYCCTMKFSESLVRDSFGQLLVRVNGLQCYLTYNTILIIFS